MKQEREQEQERVQEREQDQATWKRLFVYSGSVQCFFVGCVSSLPKTELEKLKPSNSSCWMVLVISGLMGVRTGSSFVNSVSKFVASFLFFCN